MNYEDILARKILELEHLHNSLVHSVSALLAQHNELTKKVAGLESKVDLLCPDRSDDV